VNASTSAFASITPATLIVSATGAGKVYDGSTAASVIISGAPLAGDTVDLSFMSAAFGDKNAGSGKGVSVTGIRATGADAGNYVINGAASTTADITPATLTVAASGHSKPFDNTAVADVTLSDNRIAGDDLTLTLESAAFADAEIGDDKPVAVSGIGIAGADSGNYVLANVSAATSADITGPTAPGSASTWSLPPALPQPMALVTPTAPERVLDETLPVGFAGGSVAVSSIAATATTGMDDRITVSVVRAPSPGRAGMVSVQVPQEIFRAGMDFSFPLPAALSEAARGQEVRATLGNGSPLPSWLRYMPLSRSFVAHGTPADGLPIEVLMQVGDEAWTVLITKPRAH
jgi:hypothetical protein